MTRGARPGARGTPDWILLAVLGIGACLLFANLGDRALWTDEAENALLARNVLRFGVPRGFDGVNYVSQAIVAGREDIGASGLWTLTPWLQLYVTAGSFAAFGESPWSARLPFAAAALATVALLAQLARVATRDARVARLAALLLVFCIPFLLHARQARYYALAALFATAAITAYVRLLAQRPRAALWLVLAAALLFHASYAAWIPVAAGIALHALFFARDRIPPARAAAVAAGVLALVLPWALWARVDRSAALFDPAHFAFHLLNYGITANHFVLPLAWIAVAWALARFAPRTATPREAAIPQPLLGLVLCLVATHLVFASANANYFFRYGIQLVPLLVLVHAALLVRVADRVGDRFGAPAGRAALAGLVLLATATTLPALPAFPLLAALEARAPREPWADDPLLRRPRAELATARSEIFEFLHEITHSVRGPDSAIAAFLTERAEPNDLVFADYGDLPIAFATRLAVRGGSQGVPYLGEPDWIVSRAFEATRPALARFARERSYAVHELDVADTRWESQPDPYAHRYRTVPLGTTAHPPILVYERPRERPAPDAIRLARPNDARPAARRDGPPNVLLVSMDAVRADRVLDPSAHFLGPTRLGELAARSTRFESCRTTATGTAPAAASLLTGRAPLDLGRPSALRACAPGVATLAGRLREAGYETAAIVSDVTLPAELGLAAGFDLWLGPAPGVARRADFAVAREARHWLLSRDGARPWFLWVHLGAAHGPYRAAANPFDSLAALSARVRVQTALDATPVRLLDRDGEPGGVPAYQRLGHATTAGPYRRTHDVLTLVADVFAGELLDTLRVANADATTVVSVVGTHGESLGERDVWFDHGENLDESVLRVPWIVHVPGAAPASIAEPVSLLDVAPTLAAIAGAPGAFGPDGLDVSAACRGESLDLAARSATRAELYAPQGAGDRLAVTGSHHRVETDAAGALRAFDLRQPDGAPFDPRERGDAALAALVEMMDVWRAQPPAESGAEIPLSPERRAALRSLGYADERLPPPR